MFGSDHPAAGLKTTRNPPATPQIPTALIRQFLPIWLELQNVTVILVIRGGLFVASVEESIRVLNGEDPVHEVRQNVTRGNDRRNICCYD